jgi:uncharacterized small protein (DUF1192 family)
MEDDRPRPKPSRLTILPLDDLGVAELHAYIAELRAEIARTEAMITRKQDHLGAAAKLFGGPGA